MQITWYGHSCFLLEYSGVRVLTDPYDDTVGYPPLRLDVDAITISHHHYDHDFVAAAQNDEITVIEQSTVFKDIKFTVIDSWHDDQNGALRGSNKIFIIEMGGLCLAHFGDQCAALTPDQKSMLSNIDVLFIPVGGTYTYDAKTAAEVTRELDPSLVIPMHYKTEYVDMDITYVEDFLDQMTDREIANTGCFVELTPQMLPEKGILVMNYED